MAKKTRKRPLRLVEGREYPKCPFCKEEVDGVDNRLIVEQEFTTSFTGYADEFGELDIDTSGGYDSLNEFTYSMLDECAGDVWIRGCEECA